MTDRPPVAPVEGHYALLRDGSAIGPLVGRSSGWFSINLKDSDDDELDWWSNGQFVGFLSIPHDFDIIALISPADMQAAASGEIERLKSENAFMKEQIQKLDQIMTDSIKENDGPNRVNIDGVWYDGPVVENYFNVLRVMQKAYRLILERV